MNTKFLKEKVAPLTKEQYEAKMAYAEKEAENMLMHIICYGQTLYIGEEEYTWNGCHQRVVIHGRNWHNEVPRNVAFDSFKFDIYEGKEYRVR